MATWIALGALILLFGIAIWLALRSARKWQLPPPTSPEAKQAEARLWSKRGWGER